LKIAIVGSHPATRGKAPFPAKEWEIWMCSTHNAPPHFDPPRFDRFYEVHPTSEHPTRPEDYQQWLDRLSEEQTGSPTKLWMVDRRRRPWANEYPKQRVIDEFGPYFVETSSIAYMMAHAILTIMDRRRDPPGIGAALDTNDVLGIFGVMQQSATEFAYQLPGIQFFATMAWERGIDVAVPVESGILVPRSHEF
jgi:hypothetical protein